MMHELVAAGGLAGSVACLADRLSGPARDWGPAAVVLVVMASMTCGASGTALAAGACAVAAACVWTALAGPRHGGRAPAVVDLATMALLTAGVAGAGPLGGSPDHRSGSGMPMTGGAEVPFFLFLVTCWVLARACAGLRALVGPTACHRHVAPAATRAAGRAVLRRAVLREAGSAAMVAAMAAMLA